MNNIYRYNKLNEYLKEKYGERTLKICIDGNFTCPNRDGSISTGGCIFCSKQGSGEHIHKFNGKEFDNNIAEYIKDQVDYYLNSYKSERANKFIAYFQNYTNTYDSIENLKLKYDSALIDDRIVCLDVATRPDCINEDICKHLASYKPNHDVWVELGFQTASDVIGKNINRGYDSEKLIYACNLLKQYNLETIIHIMVGLPGETANDIENTIYFLSQVPYQGLKIHSTYISKDTALEKLFLSGKYTPITLDYYIENACKILTKISPDVIIHKLSGDADKSLLVEPKWNTHKKWILNGIDKYLRDNNLYQGIYYKK